MIAMQYKILLPADYPMERIEQRIDEKAHLLNGLPGLVFKAYLYSKKGSEHDKSKVNRYAPFYLWHDHNAMVSFIHSQGFKALCEQFGRPEIKVWYVKDKPKLPTNNSRFAVITQGIHQEADIKATNYTSWESISLRWLSRIEENTKEGYQIGYLSRGENQPV